MTSNEPRATDRPGVVEDLLGDRCASLRLPVWYFDPQGTLTSSPEASGEMARWLTAPALVSKVTEHAQRALESLACEVTELFPGCRLVCLPDRSTTSEALAAVLVPELSCTETPQFAEICEAAGLSVETMQAALQDSLRASEREVEDLITLLRWTHEDVSNTGLADRTMTELGDKLVQAYEEINLLFRLARSLNFLRDPRTLMARICTEVQDVLPFGWIAVRFRDIDLNVPELARRLLVAGSLPIEAETLDEHLSDMLTRTGLTKWKKILTPEDDELAALTGSEMVAEPITHDAVVVGMLAAGSKDNDDPDVSSMETTFLDAIADLIGVFHENIARFNEQQTMFMGTLKALTSSIDAKDPYTCGHSERVAQLAWQMAHVLEMTDNEADRYRVAGLLHDVGKIGVPEAVLCKAGRLTDEEFEHIKRHPQIGYDILKDIPPLADILPGVLHHHERWDGKGYPRGLEGEQTALVARVLALCDSFDAMSSNRAYRPAMPREKVLAEIERCAGTQFDAGLVEAFISLDFSEFDRMITEAKAQQAAA